MTRSVDERTVGWAALVTAVVVALGAVSFALASVSAGPDLRWVTAGLLLVVLASTGLLCAHAGGHAWFVPLPALALAVMWALTASGPHGGTSWWLVATSASAAAAGIAVGSVALHQSLHSTPAASGPHGGSGTAVTPLTPVGVVRVAGETWTGRSLSGSLPAGAPVHVVRVDGVRLDVWSEAGTVPDQWTLDRFPEEPA